MSKIYVDEIHPKTSGGVIANELNYIAQCQLTTANSQDTSSPFTTTGVPIKFDKVTINRGNVYSTSTGNFTAPVDGIYQMSYCLATGNGSATDVNIGIEKNGSLLGTGHTYLQLDFQLLNQTTMFYIELAANDTLAVRLISGELYIDATGNYSSVNFRYLGA